MPANLTPDYKSAEAAYRRSRDPEERLAALREMYKTVPKHKGTEHLRADIKTRIKDLTEQLAGPRRTGTRSGPPTVIRPEGAAQIALLGPPNSGKSLLHARLTGSHSQTGPYPFTTQYPHPGMLPYEDITIQLVDLPPVVADHPIPWLANALQPADACLLVVDVSVPGCVEQVESLHTELVSRKVTLSGSWDSQALDEDPFAIHLPTLLVATKTDRAPRCMESVAVLEELLGIDYPALAVSSTTGAGIDQVGQWLFEHLGIVRIYTKVPGKPPDMRRPYTVHRGDTVLDVASLVHRDLAKTLKFARIWGSATFDGQQVGRDHELADGDVVELHG
jgi:ribosome-interacting GTPase 1